MTRAGFVAFAIRAVLVACAISGMTRVALGQPAPATAPAGEITPPEVVTRADTVAPGDAVAPGATVLVILGVMVDRTGVVSEVTVVQSGGAILDAAAMESVRKWAFRPAHRGDRAIAARIKVGIEFHGPIAESLPANAPASQPENGAPAGPPANSAATTPASQPFVAATAPASQPSLPASAPASQPAPAPDETPLNATVRGHSRPKDRGASTIEITTAQLSKTAQSSAGKMLEQAPGLFLANEGGAGHADQVFLRGFDAEQGQDIEFTVNGLPINEVDNTDGHGYADTHFIIPEVVKTLRVVEGPFDPHQGDFAVAGGANYELGVTQRGVRIDQTFGSFSSERTLFLWAPEGEREGTFGAVQLANTAGYGVNRAATDASAMAEYEGDLGTRGLYRVLVTMYGTHYKSAGVVRADDVSDGAVDYYGTEDASQGGDAQRYTVSFDLENPTDAGVVKQQVFLTYRTLHIVEDFTGFLLDNPEPGQSFHVQRGDAIDQDYEALTLGARGSYRMTDKLLGHEQAIEVGYYARYDHTIPEIQRLRFGTEIPYLIDTSLTTDVVNVAGFVDVDLHPTGWLTLRGGVREEFFGYDVLNNCATDGEYVSKSPLNVTCPAYDPSGERLPTTRVTATGIIAEPKVTAIAQLPAGVSVTGSYGVGAQSMDASTISQDENAPFSTLHAAELGAIYHHRDDDFDLSARAVGYYTHVDRDLIFDPLQGRLSASTGTTRRGVVAAVQATGHWWNELASFTYAYATYDADGALVPYVPSVVARSDTSIVHALPYQIHGHDLIGSLGLGLNYVGTRALPLGQSASPTFTLDGSAAVRWRWLKVGVEGQNLADAKYPLSEFFYASDFHKGPIYPTLAPSLNFTAAAPRTILFTLGIATGEEANR